MVVGYWGQWKETVLVLSTKYGWKSFLIDNPLDKTKQIFKQCTHFLQGILSIKKITKMKPHDFLF